MVKMIIKNKSGVMDDFTDLLYFVLILSMVSFIAVVVLRTDMGDKEDQTLDKLASFQGQEALLDLVNYPVIFSSNSDEDGKEAVMKDVIIAAANANGQVTVTEKFTEKMQEYFEQQQIEGGIAVYDSVSYGTEEEPEPFLSYSNVVFLGDEKGTLYLTNVYGEGNKKLLVVKLFG